ncbi:MAG: DNA translocase FtsK, partial [Pirellulales bacterium]|nr:DNA translocase FtsK [Pirellulales bacterium]
MLDERDLKLDLLALGLLGLTVFLASSLLSYHPGDPPSTLVYPPQTETLNVCGRSGALVSSWLFTGLGLGAYYLLISLAVLDSLLLARRRIDEPVVRFCGWLMSLVGVATLAAMALPHLSPGPVIGSGGYLGATGRAILERHFASVGAYILTLSVIFGGLLLATDYHLLRVLYWLAWRPIRMMLGTLPRRGKAANGRAAATRRRQDDLTQDGPTVRIAGRDSMGVDAEKDDEETEEETSEQPADDAKEPSREPVRVRKPKKTQREETFEELEAADVDPAVEDYELPPLDLLSESEEFCFDEHEKEVRRKAKVIEKTFADFGFKIQVVEIQTGPVIAQFEVALEAGLRLSRITSLADDLAIALRVPSVRIVAPLPGKNTVGIEVPNTERQLVRLREVIEEAGSRAQKMRIPIFLGKDVAGNPMVVDLASMPHLLIAGRTGTGKSVCLNSMIVSMLMTRRPDEVRLLLVDPKLVELSPYKRLPHLMHPVVTDMRKAEAILGWAVEKMEERYQLLARAGVRHISVYNQLGEEELMERMQIEDEEERRHIPTHMPFIVIIADEIADLMMTAAKEVEGHIIRLAQKSRAVGIHLVLATQKPTVDVITGLIKSNLPARVSFQVASRTDSRVVLDEMGAERLLGNGDMLFLWPGTSTLIRGQGTYLSDDEINAVIDSVSTTEPQYVKELVQLKAGDPSAAGGSSLADRDELYEAAIDVVVREGRGSVSLLQRALGIGYGRAARLIDYMAEDGFVGPYNGSQAREVTLTFEDWQAMTGQSGAASESSTPPSPLPPPPPTRRNNRIRVQTEEVREPGGSRPRRTTTRSAVSLSEAAMPGGSATALEDEDPVVEDLENEDLADEEDVWEEVEVDEDEALDDTDEEEDVPWDEEDEEDEDEEDDDEEEEIDDDEESLAEDEEEEVDQQTEEYLEDVEEDEEEDEE